MGIFDNLTPDDIQRLRDLVLGDPTVLPEGFVGWLPPYLALHGLDIPISQVSGYAQTVPQQNRLAAGGTTSSATYTDLTGGGTGPQLAGLPDGQYLFLWGSVVQSSGGAGTYMGLKVDSTEATDAEAAWTTTTSTAIATSVVKTLSGTGNHTVTSRYRVGGGTGSYEGRWLVGLRVANA